MITYETKVVGLTANEVGDLSYKVVLVAVRHTEEKMFYSTWKTSRWQIYSSPIKTGLVGFNRINGVPEKFIRVEHINLIYDFDNLIYNIDKCVDEVVKKEESSSNTPVKNKEKKELKKYFKRFIKDYIKSRLRKGFEYELFTVK